LQKVFKVAVATLVMIFAGADQALALPPSECVSASYSCTTNGYAGQDSYGYYKYSTLDAAGRKHNCTSYAAFQIGLMTPYNANYGKLGDATIWASRARAFGLSVSSVPHASDIAQWNYGHVAFVEDVVYFASGRVAYIVTTSDNAGITDIAPRVTRRSVIYPSESDYPDNFISFPRYLSGGGTPPIAMIMPLTNG
jgi:hypothetical protein